MALKGMVTKQLKHLKNFWKLGRDSDFLIWCITFSVTVFVDLDWGLMIGVVATVNTIFQILARGKLNELGRAPGTNEYIDAEKGGVEYPKIKVVKLESALFFGSKDRFYERVGEYFRKPTPSTTTYMGADTRKQPNDDGDIAPSYHTLVIDASAIIFIDVAGVQKVLTLARGLRKNNSARVLIARASDSVVKMLTAGGLVDVNAGGLNGSETFFETVSEAVLAGAAAGLFVANPSDPLERCNSLRCFTSQGGTGSAGMSETVPLLGGGRSRAWDAETAL
jgi:MFS superfamily sulfate permease-like transporter